jgi:poly(3-hydroxybutyrate) depolymerase
MRAPFFFGSIILSLATGVLSQSKGCGKALPGDIELGRSKNQTIDSESGHTPRKYRIHVPKTYDNSVPVPLILSYHGRNQDMKFQEKLSQFANASFGFEGISVFPEGVPVSFANLGTRIIMTDTPPEH